MAAPLAKGIIIAATVVVAGALVLYESPELRMWLDERRRRIAIAVYSVGDSISPTPSSRATEAEAEAVAEASRRRRQEIIRRNRAQLIKRAQEEGVAVDLDELESLGKEVETPKTATTFKSFDEMLGSDGKLKSKTPEMVEASSTATAFGSEGALRNRSAGSRGWDRGASFANPFDDEAQILFDRELIAPSQEEVSGTVITASSPATLRSVSPRPVPTLIDIPVLETVSESTNSSNVKSQEEFDAEIEEAIRRSLQDVPAAEVNLMDLSIPQPAIDFNAIKSSQMERSLGDSLLHADPMELSSPAFGEMENSLYAPPTPRVESRTISPEPATMQHSVAESFVSCSDPMEEDDRSSTPSGVRTPSEAGFSSSVSASDVDILTAASAASDAEDIANLAEVSSLADNDTRSEADMSEFSVVGASTPGSWTDVDSESEAEEAHNGQHHR